MLPRLQKEPGKFNLPYVNGKFIIPLLVLLFVFWRRDRIEGAISNIADEAYQEILFLLFIILAIGIAIFSFLRNYSLIPVLGMLCCLYLMIEIPAASWGVFFLWMAIGLLFYFLYGRQHSKLAKAGQTA